MEFMRILRNWWWYILMMACILALTGHTAYEQITNPNPPNPNGCNADMKAGDYPPGF